MMESPPAACNVSAPTALPLWRGKTMVRLARFPLESAAVIDDSFVMPEGQGVPEMLRGSITALVTPFAKNGGFDEKAFRAFVDWQIAEGTSGLVPVGTTGESPTLSHDEHRQVVKVCVEVAKRQGAGHRRRRLQQHRRGGRPRAICREGRRRRGAGGDALLQQADPARPLCAFRRRRQGDQPAGDHLQHPAALGDRHDAGDDGPAGARLQEHRRRQGCDRQGRARVGAAPDLRQGFHPAFRRGRLGARASTRMAASAPSR